MDADSSLEAAAFVISLALYAIFSSAEGYLLSTPQSNGSEQQNTLQLKARALLRNRGVHTLVHVGLVTVVVASGIALIMAVYSHWWGVGLGVVGLLVLLSVVQGVATGIGKRWSGNTHRVVPFLWPLVMVVVPLSKLQTSIAAVFYKGGKTDSVTSELGMPPANGGSNEVAEDHTESELAPHERKMITSILKLDETTAREIMIPRMDIQAAEATSSLNAVAELMWDSGHSRIPLFEESLDNIIGVVHSRDMLRNLASNEADLNLGDIVRPPLFIPASKRLDDLLRDFQENHIQIAIVVDEYGGTAGLVTIEDLLEEIVGEIEDEFDVVESMREMLSESEAVMDARISLDEVNRIFAVNLQGEGFDTLGGLLYQQLGKMPSPGDSVKVDGLTIKVISTLGRRIKKVQVALTTPSEY